MKLMVFNHSYIKERKDLAKIIKGKGHSILDVGCATGSTGDYLLKNEVANKVVGVELDGTMAKKAQEVLTKIIQGSVENEKTINCIMQSGPFDYIIMGDILEHLNNPWNILSSFRDALTDEGAIIISIPNVQHIDVFIHVFIKGTWPRNDRGIFDKTHLRWFTLKNVIEMVESAGLKLKWIKRKYRYRDEVGSKFPFYGKILKKFFKNYYTYQYVIVCQKKAA